MRVLARTVRAAIVVGGIVCLGVGLHAQDTPQSPPPRPITESAERLARELWSVDDGSATDEQDRPLFRASITEYDFVLPPPWYMDPPSGPIQPRSRLYHQEFLSVVTPLPFRASAMAAASAGVSVDPGAMFDGVRSAWRSRQARRARERIEREVAQLRARAAGSPSSEELPTGDAP